MFHFKNYSYLDSDAFMKFLRKNFTPTNHGLLANINSFSVFHSGSSSTKKKNTWKNVYLYQDIGYAYMCDVVVDYSFHNVLMGAFGRNPNGISSNSEVDFIAQPELPGLSHYRKWGNHDCLTGRSILFGNNITTP